MALWSRPDPAEAAPSGADEFEGRSAEEALLRAREALGPSVELRCWKTRRGGVAGFFATELYVAGVQPPPGADGPAPRRRRAARARAAAREASSGGTSSEGPPDHATGEDDPVAQAAQVADEPDTGAGVGSAPSEQVPDTLAALVEDTTDQLTLQFDPIPSAAFDDVLAEAEAALTAGDAAIIRDERSAEPAPPPPEPAPEPDPPEPEPSPIDGDAAPPPPEPAPGTDPPAIPARRPAGAKAPKTGAKSSRTGAKSPGAAGKATGEKAASSPAVVGYAAAPARADAPARRPSRPKATGPSVPAARKPPPRPVPDLYERLRGLGVPEAHMPRSARATLDALLQAMDRLPVAPPLPTEAGTVVVVVGTRGPVDRTARLLLGESPYRHGPRRAPGQRPWTVDDPAPSDDSSGGLLQTGDDLLAVQQVARRRSAGRPSLVTVESDPGLPIRSTTLAFIESLRPDYVLGAVSASMKRQDVERWKDHLPSMDAVALWGVESTYSPAELLGAVPITFVDGEASSAMGWTVTLLSRAMEPRE